jgi:hypothetical protein
MPARPSRSLGYGLAVVAGLGVVYYAAPLAVGLISLGAICPYSPAGTTICAGKEAAPATVTNLPPGLNTVLDAQQGGTALQRGGDPLRRHYRGRSRGLLHADSRPQAMGRDRLQGRRRAELPRLSRSWNCRREDVLPRAGATCRPAAHFLLELHGHDYRHTRGGSAKRSPRVREQDVQMDCPAPPLRTS